MYLKLFLLAGAVACPMLHATIAYNNFGAGMSFADVTVDTGDEVAQLFTAGATGYLTSLTFAFGVSNNATTTSYENIFIYDDNAGTPGSLLEEILNVNAGDFSRTGEVVTADSAANPLLVSGDSYWVGTQAVDRVDNPVIWYWGVVPVDQGTDVYLGGTWVPFNPTPTDAYSLQVNVSSGVPEPGSFVLLVAGGAALLLRRKLAS